MESPIILFIVIAILCAIGLWALAQFPTLDATVVKFIRIGVFILLSVLLLNLILFLLVGKTLAGVLHGG